MQEQASSLQPWPLVWFAVGFTVFALIWLLVGAFLSAWYFHCGRTGRSPMPTLPGIRFLSKDDKDTNGQAPKKPVERLRV